MFVLERDFPLHPLNCSKDIKHEVKNDNLEVRRPYGYSCAVGAMIRGLINLAGGTMPK